MKASNNHKLILVTIAFLLTVIFAYSYPPDNAAVLYYKAATLYEADGKMSNMLSDLRSGRIEPNETIRNYINENRFVIETVLDAAELKNCDWGIDYSRGMEAKLPPLASFRNIAFLIAADAKILAEDGDYKTAMNRCMSLCKMARHTNDRVFVNYLVGIAIQGMANGCITQIMADMPQDMETLAWLKNRLIEIDSIPFSVKPALLGEREIVLTTVTAENKADLVSMCENDESLKEIIINADDALIERNRKHFNDFYDEIIDIFDMPYQQGQAAMTDLFDELYKDPNNSDTILTRVLMPAVGQIYSLATRIRTHDNAIRAAIELYMIKAKTGKLPDSLPEGLPGDLFSGKDFEYQITNDGFILRCPGKDLTRNEVYEYEFKVKK